MNEDDINKMKLILAELVHQMGGVVELDATKLVENIKSNELKDLGIRLENGKVIVEVFSINED